MRIHPRILSTAAAIAVTCVVSAAAYFYKSRNTEINEVMIFCKLQFNAYNYFDKLISYVEAAKRSINVCMPGIHNPAIQGRLVSLIKKKNIKARILIDPSGYNESTEFLVKELADAGAEIKCIVNEPQYRMHHKFCLIDDNVLMTGTLNWGDDRSSDHWNYVYVTSKLQLVEPVKKGFYQMWNEFSTDAASIADDSSTATVEIDYHPDIATDFTIMPDGPRIKTPELVLV
ncbi:hypothetical protein ABMA28_004767 [Loxostege sticticalis]|uniref:Mitochondrial cardiolipin hydrolase n=1 Tax=Loxostege sticticalis TaxID=481309 RepID=A0ABD0SUQ1_LOXSC